MRKFTVTIKYQDGKYEVHGSDSPCIPAKGPTMSHAGGEPAEGGLEEITQVYLLGRDGKRVDLPEWLQDELDNPDFHAEIEDSVRKELDELRDVVGEDYI
jgi:hypothetical protein